MRRDIHQTIRKIYRAQIRTILERAIANRADLFRYRRDHKTYTVGECEPTDADDIRWNRDRLQRRIHESLVRYRNNGRWKRHVIDRIA